MSKQREALEMALLALEIAPLDHNSVKSTFFEKRHYAIIALREALAEPEKTNQCGETCERAELCAVCAGGVSKNEQEPVAWTTKGQIAAMDSGFIRYIEGRDPRFVLGRHDDVPLYTAPPARKPLTEPELHAIEPTWPNEWNYDDVLAFVRAIERAHGIGSTGQ